MPSESIGYCEELTKRIRKRRESIHRTLREYRKLLRSESSGPDSNSLAAKAKVQRRLERYVKEYLVLCRAFERAQSIAE